MAIGNMGAKSGLKMVECLHDQKQQLHTAQKPTINALAVQQPTRQTVKDCDEFSEEISKLHIYRKLSIGSSAELEVSSGDEVRLILRTYLDAANSARDDFEDRRKYHSVSRFLVNFNAYLDAYGGIVEAMRAAGGDWGQAVYKVLALLLVIAANKQKRDERITEMLDALGRQFSRFQLLETIHAAPQLRVLIEEAYWLGIGFAQFAVRYYLRGSWRRIWSVIKEPPDIFEENLTKLVTAYEEVRQEWQVLDSQRLQVISQDVDDVRRRLSEREAHDEEIQRQLRVEKMDRLRQMVLTPTFEPGSTSRYQFRLDAQFNGDRQDPEIRVPLLRSSVAYIRWLASPKSSVLVLRGEARDTTHFSWFSPLALRLSQSWKRDGQAVAFQSCQEVDTKQRGYRFPWVLRLLVAELLETMPAVLSLDDLEALSTKVKKLQREKEAIDLLEIMEQICSALTKVYLVIDRADLMRGDWEECLAKLCEVARPKRSGGCVFKILIVGSRVTSDWVDVKQRLAGILGTEDVFELHSSEYSWSDGFGKA